MTYNDPVRMLWIGDNTNATNPREPPCRGMVEPTLLNLSLTQPLCLVKIKVIQSDLKRGRPMSGKVSNFWKWVFGKEVSIPVWYCCQKWWLKLSYKHPENVTNILLTCLTIRQARNWWAQFHTFAHWVQTIEKWIRGHLVSLQSERPWKPRM